jgi:hypothetical protein
MTERKKLEHKIYVLGQIVKANMSALNSKSMRDDDRDALQRQITIRLGHQRLLQNRLKRLSK